MTDIINKKKLNKFTEQEIETIIGKGSNWMKILKKEETKTEKKTIP